MNLPLPPYGRNAVPLSGKQLYVVTEEVVNPRSDTMVLPEYTDPKGFWWPVKGCDVAVIGKLSKELALSISQALRRDQATSIVLIDPDTGRASFWPHSLIPRG
jgi:hypothetical protein